MPRDRVEALIELIARWMKGKKTGSITVHFNQGGIVGATKREDENFNE